MKVYPRRISNIAAQDLPRALTRADILPTVARKGPTERRSPAIQNTQNSVQELDYAVGSKMHLSSHLVVVVVVVYLHDNSNIQMPHADSEKKSCKQGPQRS